MRPVRHDHAAGLLEGEDESPWCVHLQLGRDGDDDGAAWLAVQAYDAATLVLETIRKDAQSGQDVWDQLVRRSDLPALSGFASFSSAGILNRRLYILQINNRAFTQLN